MQDTPTIPPKVLEAIEKEVEEIIQQGIMKEKPAKEILVELLSRAYWMVSEAWDHGYDVDSHYEDKESIINQLFKIKA